jgi:DNA-binding transcriptional MerR regulator
VASTSSLDEELTVEQLSTQTGISVRNLRFYTTRGLVPPPAKRGRSAVYTREHVARFELLQDLQGHGLNLTAIEKYFESIPADATAEQIALHRTTLRPLASLEPVTLTRRELEARAGRRLSDTELDKLATLGGVEAVEGKRYAVNEARMRSSLGMIDRGIPLELVQACDEIYRRHGKAMAQELETLFRETLWPAYKSGEMPADNLVAMLDNWEQAGAAVLVEAFSEAITEARRDIVERRTSEPNPSR